MKAWASDFCLLLLMVAIGYSVEALSLAGIVTPLTLVPAAFTSVTYTMPASTLPVSTWVSTDFFARSFTDATFAGLLGGVATSMTFLAKSCGLDASPALTTASMFLGDAEANTSAGAPLVIWVDRPELGPKLNFTVSPGWAVSNCFPSWVKVSVSDAAANTVMDTGAAEGLALGELPELPLEQPAT